MGNPLLEDWDSRRVTRSAARRSWGSLVAWSGWRRVRRARTRGFAPPAFAGFAFVAGVANWQCEIPRGQPFVKNAPGPSAARTPPAW